MCVGGVLTGSSSHVSRNQEAGEAEAGPEDGPEVDLSLGLPTADILLIKISGSSRKVINRGNNEHLETKKHY